MNTTIVRPARCEGGATGSCTSRATWSVRLPGDSDHTVNLADER
ncbi:hypothetical protein [Kitasatospora viridis]|uniref:Uncharacterized protein n=1 Tax=Kitasatospora viridis TaxID=281105 RepID=A0A561UKR9_9ACTN|nr:hypothetical protein [Kitasatospora viridis]TWF99936.1 hypothetical protein FHX73_113796 [Kitasatospora viridis]